MLTSNMEIGECDDKLCMDESGDAEVEMGGRGTSHQRVEGVLLELSLGWWDMESEG